MNLFDLLKGYKQIQFDNQLLEWKIAKDILELGRRDILVKCLGTYSRCQLMSS